jgi:hypothetical protein
MGDQVDDTEFFRQQEGTPLGRIAGFSIVYNVDF